MKSLQSHKLTLVVLILIIFFGCKKAGEEVVEKIGKKIADSFPCVDMFRMLGSGTEACMAAIRVA